FFFHAIGLEICEGYGMTENCATTTLNRMGGARIGTVGPPLPGVEVTIAGDGEVLMRGDVVFAGYHKDPAATAETVVDGWLHTGDIGELGTDGLLRITDRKKELILKHHPLISNAVVIGDRRPYVSALITLNTAEAEAYAKSHAAEVGEVALGDHPAIREALRQHVEAVNAKLANVEKVKRWTVLGGDFTVGEALTT